jgi:hypothetical protein
VATIAESCLLLLSSDHLPHYVHAILKVFGKWVRLKRMSTKRRFYKKRLEAPEGLEYAIVHKEHRKSRVISVKTMVVFRKEEGHMAPLRSMGMQKINTSFVDKDEPDLTPSG